MHLVLKHAALSSCNAVTLAAAKLALLPYLRQQRSRTRVMPAATLPRRSAARRAKTLNATKPVECHGIPVWLSAVQRGHPLKNRRRAKRSPSAFTSSLRVMPLIPFLLQCLSVCDSAYEASLTEKCTGLKNQPLRDCQKARRLARFECVQTCPPAAPEKG